MHVLVLTIGCFRLFFFRLSQNCGKRLLAVSCFCVRTFAWNKSASTERIFAKLGIWMSLKICRDNSRFIKIWQDLRAHHMKANKYFWSYLAQFFLRWGIFLTKVVEDVKKPHSMFNNFFFENSAVYEIMWKNIVESNRSQMTVWRMRISRCLPKATNTQPENM